MQRVFEVVDQVAPSRATVLITGESGTGKELVANAIHQRSPRANGPFVKLHCAALAESLLESELFGHEKRRVHRRDGAQGRPVRSSPTAARCSSTRSARSRRRSRSSCCASSRSTSSSASAATQTIKVDVRVIAATNRDLADEVAKGRFREDLYYRLNVVALEMPPLRERRTDIPALAKFFLERYAKENGKTIDGFAPRDARAADGLRLAGQRARARERDRARGRARRPAPTIEPRTLPPNVRPTAHADRACR